MCALNQKHAELQQRFVFKEQRDGDKITQGLFSAAQVGSDE